MKPLVNSPSARDIQYFVHPYTNLKAHQTEGPLVMREGKGVWVTDDAGNKYIEGLASLWCVSLGFNEERLIDAAVEQMRRLPSYHTFAGKSHDPGIDLAERLIKIAPVPMSKVFFANSGSEANDTVVKLVWYYNNALDRPKKKKIIARIKGYHGVTVAAASLTGLPNNHRDFDLPIANIVHTECPHYYRFGKPGETEEQFATRMAEALEQKILAEGGAEHCAAFIAEPIMGAGGVITPPKTYFEKIQAVVKKYDMLMIADEVICGFGRTGQMWGSQTYDIEPDILTCAKALTGGYVPFSATLISQRVYEPIAEQSAKIGTFGHGYTYSAHPLGAAVAIEAMKIYREIDIAARVRSLAPQLHEGLRTLAASPIVGEVRGVGLIAAVELVKNKTTRESFPPGAAIAGYFAERAHAHGLVLRALGEAVALCPPLVIEPAETDEMLARFTRALRDTEAYAERFK